MNATQGTLHDFWFEPAPPTRLAILRILIGAFAVWYVVTGQDDLARVTQTDARLFAPVGVVCHAPVGLELFHWILRGAICLSICFTLGLWHRITGPLFAAMLLWLLCYRNSWSMIYHDYNLLALHAIVLGLTRSADALSLDATLHDLRHPGTRSLQPAWQYGWPIKLIIGLTVGAYFVSAVCKLAGPLGLSWMTGQNLRAQMAVDGLRKELLGVDPNPVAYKLYDLLPLFSILAVGSLILELFAPLALVNKRIGRVWAINTLMMHWGILFVMGITFRYQLSGIIFAPFFPLEKVLDWPGRIWGRRATDRKERPPEPAVALTPRPGTTHATLYYDGECGLCDRFVQFVLRHDRREYFQFAALQSASGHEVLARMGLPPDDLKSVVLVEPAGSFVRSSATLRVCWRLSGLWPLLYAFIAVPKSWRDGVYSLVARNRKRWFKPPAECPVMPPEWRRRFVG
jgi:predicted DCC family thiol-disulfide oxidoreductase YuxK